MSESYVIGVDGGGTKTEAWLAQFDPAGNALVRGRGRAGSSNPRAVGLETALSNLAAAISAAWDDAGLAPFPVDCALLAMSGAGHQSVREQIAAWASARKIARIVRFEHDVEPVFVEGTPEGWGVALIVGTGSAAIGVSREGRRLIIGGWGYHYGDEGSAYWIGRRALQAIARAADGRAAETALAPAVMGRLSVTEPRAILTALEHSGNVRGAIAGLADLVEQTAQRGDPVALGIVDAAAEELAAMLEALAGQLELGETFPLALAGGVICGSDLLRGRLVSRLASWSLRPQPITAVPQPVAGCLKLAWRSLQETNRAR